MQEYDLVVVGAGLAGLTAGMFGARYGLRTVVIDQMGAGGQILNAEKIENFPGFPQGVAGYDLGPLVQEQAEGAGCGFMMDSVLSLEIDGDDRILRCAEEEVRAKGIIIAAGSTMRSLGVPGEERFEGRGVSHCASCDGAFFAGQEVCVVGGGDSALDEAAVLAEHASRVLVFHRGVALSTQQAILQHADSKPNIEVFLNTRVEEIVGEDQVTGVRVVDTGSGQSRLEELAGVFVYVGLEPNTRFLQGVLDLDSTGHIVTNILMRTSLPGVFAAGDIRSQSVAQLASSVGDGATAAIAAYRHITRVE